jgi:hypothetical protein
MRLLCSFAIFFLLAKAVAQASTAGRNPPPPPAKNGIDIKMQSLLVFKSCIKYITREIVVTPILVRYDRALV